MFCLGCGTELRPHAEACSICGRRVAEGPVTIAASTGRLPVAPAGGWAGSSFPPPPSPKPAPIIRTSPPLTPSIGYGDVEALGLPRDRAGRWVLVIGLLLAGDLYLPWVALGDSHIAPSLFGVPAALAAALLLAAAASVMYGPLRQRPYYAAIPLVLGAVAFGAGGMLWLLLGPFASQVTGALVARALANPALGRFVVQNGDTVGFVPAPDVGLYAFVVGAAVLTVAGYQLFVSAVATAVVPASRPTGEARPHPTKADQETMDPEAAGMGAAVAIPGRPSLAPLPASAAQSHHPDIALPGTPGWTQEPDAPSIQRNSPAIRGQRSQGKPVGPRPS